MEVTPLTVLILVILVLALAVSAVYFLFNQFFSGFSKGYRGEYRSESKTPKLIGKEKESPSSSQLLAKRVQKTFISYRRADSGDVTGRIYDNLVGRFGRGVVFKDVDTIPLGADFRSYLDEAVAESDVFLAIIGPRWLRVQDADRSSFLDDPKDFVRIEIASALQRGIPLIPVLVSGATMPSEQDLPDVVGELSYRNGVPVRPDPDFHNDIERLSKGIQKLLESKQK
jgi:hypothetical protein